MSLPDTHPLRKSLSNVEHLQPVWFKLSKAILEVIDQDQDYTVGELLDLLPLGTDPVALVTAMIPLCSYEAAIFNAGGFLMVGKARTDLSNDEFSGVINANVLSDPQTGIAIKDPSKQTYLCFRYIPGSWDVLPDAFKP